MAASVLDRWEGHDYLMKHSTLIRKCAPATDDASDATQHGTSEQRVVWIDVKSSRKHPITLPHHKVMRLRKLDKELEPAELEAEQVPVTARPPPTRLPHLAAAGTLPPPARLPRACRTWLLQALLKLLGDSAHQITHNSVVRFGANKVIAAMKQSDCVDLAAAEVEEDPYSACYDLKVAEVKA